MQKYYHIFKKMKKLLLFFFLIIGATLAIAEYPVLYWEDEIFENMSIDTLTFSDYGTVINSYNTTSLYFYVNDYITFGYYLNGFNAFQKNMIISRNKVSMTKEVEIGNTNINGNITVGKSYPVSSKALDIKNIFGCCKNSTNYICRDLSYNNIVYDNDGNYLYDLGYPVNMVLGVNIWCNSTHIMHDDLDGYVGLWNYTAYDHGEFITTEYNICSQSGLAYTGITSNDTHFFFKCQNGDIKVYSQAGFSYEYDIEVDDEGSWDIFYYENNLYIPDPYNDSISVYDMFGRKEKEIQYYGNWTTRNNIISSNVNNNSVFWVGNENSMLNIIELNASINLATHEKKFNQLNIENINFNESIFNSEWIYANEYKLQDLIYPVSGNRFRLKDYIEVYATNDLEHIGSDNSGGTYSPLTGTLFMVQNGGPTLNEFMINGSHIREITLTNFLDTEGISWMYGDTFAISQERVADPSVYIVKITNDTTALDSTDWYKIEPDIDITDNKGIEGITWDYDNEWFYVAIEKGAAGNNGGRIFILMTNGTAINLTTLGQNLLSKGYNDLADIYYDRESKHVFLLAQEQNTIIEATLGGDIIYERKVDTGIFSQPEGLSFSLDGRNMFLFGEADDYAHYVLNPINNLSLNVESLVVNGVTIDTNGGAGGSGFNETYDSHWKNMTDKTYDGVSNVKWEIKV